MTVDQMQGHIGDLLQKHKIKVLWAPAGGWSNSQNRSVGFPIVKDDVSYATALHEIGHILKAKFYDYYSSNAVTTSNVYPKRFKRFCYKLRLKSEERAWEWAKNNTLEWTPEMEVYKIYCLGTYQQYYKEVYGG